MAEAMELATAILRERNAEIAFLRETVRQLTECLKPAQKVALGVAPAPTPKEKLPEEIEDAIRLRRFDDRSEAANRRLAEVLLARGATVEHIVTQIKQGATAPTDGDLDLYAVMA